MSDLSAVTQAAPPATPVTAVTPVSAVSGKGGRVSRGRTGLKRIAAQIAENVRALNAQEISLAEFDARQRAAWDAVGNGEQRIVGSACARRHVRVIRYLGIAA